MNKKNKILVGCLALLLALSVGYALFSETITINGSATAKGDFENEIICYAENYPDAINDLFGDMGLVLGSGYENPQCSVSGNRVTFGIDLLYPSAGHIIVLELKNTGTIDALYEIYDNFDVPVQNNVKETQVLRNKETNEVYSTITDPSKIDTMNYGSFENINGFALMKADGTIVRENADLNANESFYENSSGTLYLRVKPGESLLIGAWALWATSAVQTDYYSTITYEAQFNAVQLTSDYTLVTDGELCFAGC